MIDLGLPSGTKWACCNVGADNPQSYGGYYACNTSTYTHDSDFASHYLRNQLLDTPRHQIGGFHLS